MAISYACTQEPLHVCPNGEPMPSYYFDPGMHIQDWYMALRACRYWAYVRGAKC